MTVDMDTATTTVERASDSVPNTRRWARVLHGKQKDKNGLPYVTHLDAVAQNLLELVGFDRDLIMACYLHDTIEDVIGFKAADLEDAGYSEKTIYTVNVVTKRPSEPNPAYTRRVIAGGVFPSLVKLADLYHNTRPDRIAKLTPYQQDRLLEKYITAIFRIENFLCNEGVLSPKDRTVTFEQAYELVKPVVYNSTSTTYDSWWKRPLVSIWKGDLLKFPLSGDPDREWVVIEKRVKGNGAYAVTLEGWDGDIVLSKTSDYLSKFKPTAVHSGTYHALWKQRLGLAADWVEGDEVPQYLDGEKIPEAAKEETPSKEVQKYYPPRTD